MQHQRPRRMPGGKGENVSIKDLPAVSVLEDILQAALEQRDMEGVGHVLKLIAVQDPHRAQTLLDTMKFGIAITKERAHD